MSAGPSGAGGGLAVAPVNLKPRGKFQAGGLVWGALFLEWAFDVRVTFQHTQGKRTGSGKGPGMVAPIGLPGAAASQLRARPPPAQPRAPRCWPRYFSQVLTHLLLPRRPWDGPVVLLHFPGGDTEIPPGCRDAPRAAPLAGRGRPGLAPTPLGVSPWPPEGPARPRVPLFCSESLQLSVTVPSPPGPQAQSPSPLNSGFPFPRRTSRHVTGKGASLLRPSLPPMSTALLRAFTILTTLLCPNRFIFLIIK